MSLHVYYSNQVALLLVFLKREIACIHQSLSDASAYATVAPCTAGD